MIQPGIVSLFSYLKKVRNSGGVEIDEHTFGDEHGRSVEVLKN